ncbi:hypothetical protein CFC21_068922, partial [Triticum aestivum]
EEDTENISNWEKKEVCGKKRKSQSFRDEDHYISSVPQNQHSEAGLSVKGNEGFVQDRLDAAVLDLVDDETSGMQAQKTRYHWMKNKFVKLNNGDRVTSTGKIKTESSAKLKASKDIYKKWQQKSHRAISSGGKDGAEGGSSTPAGYQRGNRRYPAAGRGRSSIPNADVPSEIRNPQQMRKGRQEKAMQNLRRNERSAKDGKSPGKFQKNRRPNGSGRDDKFQDSRSQKSRRPDGKGKGGGKGNAKGFGKGKGKGKGNPKGRGTR